MFRKSARGLFDFLMAAMAFATLLTTTPTGELIARSGRWAGHRISPGWIGKGRERDLLSFFGNSAEANPDKPLVPAFTPPEPDSPVAIAAHASGAAPSVLFGFEQASGADPASVDHAMNLEPEGRALLVVRGASDVDLASPSGRLKAVGEAIANLSASLGSPDAALCALVLGLGPVQYAVERVKAERGELSLEGLAPHLPPATRTRVSQIVGNALALATLSDLAWPVPLETRIGSRFGPRLDPIKHTSQLHNGVDLGVSIGTPIWATGMGTVSRANEDGLNGKFVVVSHGRGITTGYCHNSELLVGRGDHVARGKTITLSGNTGYSTGPHLHYTLAVNGVAIDPLAANSERASLLSKLPKPAEPAPAPKPVAIVVPKTLARADAGSPPAEPVDAETVPPEPPDASPEPIAEPPDAAAVPEPAPLPPPALDPPALMPPDACAPVGGEPHPW